MTNPRLSPVVLEITQISLVDKMISNLDKHFPNNFHQEISRPLNMISNNPLDRNLTNTCEYLQYLLQPTTLTYK